MASLVVIQVPDLLETLLTSSIGYLASNRSHSTVNNLLPPCRLLSFLSSSSSIGGITTLNAEEQVVPCLEANKTLQLEEQSRKDQDGGNRDGALLPKISVKEDPGVHNT